MNLNAVREIVARELAAAVDAAGYDSDRIDWAGFNFDAPQPAIPGSAAAPADALWFRAIHYTVPTTSRPLALGAGAPNERREQLRLSVFVPTGEGDVLGPEALDAVWAKLARNAAGERRRTLDSTGLVSVEWADPDGPEYVGRFGAWVEYVLTSTLRVEDHT